MIIHQALHGYSQGHNKLASSYPLSTQDDDKMKMLSDWSEFSGNKDNSYITTYPLSDSKHYVIAKSWYADDMERPGCVWTHSLILDLTNIDEKFDFRSLTGLFKRPVKGDYTSYSETINYTLQTKICADVFFQEDMLVWLYTNIVNIDANIRMLYRVELESSYYQNLILLLLQYLPLGFFRNISMCSGSAYGRKYSNIEYNLQFATSAKTSLETVVKDSKGFVDHVCDGIKSICKAMLREESDTSEFLRLFSNEIENSPIKLCGVGLLSKYLDEAIAKSNDTPSFSCILDLLSNTFPSKTEGKDVKVSFCKKSVSNLFSSESIVLTDMATKVSDDWLDSELIDYFQRVSSLKSEVNLNEFVQYLINLVNAKKVNTVGKLVLKESDKYLNKDDYNYIASNHWSLYMSLVMANANVLKFSFWIDLPEEHFALIYDVFRKHCLIDFDAWDKLFLVVLYRNHTIDKTIMECFSKYVSNNITFEVMTYLNKSAEYRLNSFLHDYCKNQVDNILNWLKTQNELTLPAVVLLIDCVVPQSQAVKNAGSDIWIILQRCNCYEQLEYYVFLFILGHNWNDTNALQYIKHSFYPIYMALYRSTMPDILWRKIEPYTAKLNFLKEWDKCKKIQKGIVRYLKSTGYPRSVLNTLTNNEEVNNLLKEDWDKE